MDLWFKWLLVAVLTVCVVLAGIAGFEYYRIVYRPMPVDATNPPIIILKNSSTAVTFVHDLQKQHLIDSPNYLLKMMRSHHLTSVLKAGVYSIKPQESVWQFLQRVVRGDVVVKTFRIIDGTTLRQVSENLEKARYLNYNRADWLLIADSHLNAEGLLMADTYQYRGGSSSKTLLLQAHQQLLAYLTQAWQTRDPSLPYKNMYELLTAASIIEKEAGLRDEKYLVSSVIANRLKRHMPLQMDPTIIYAMGESYHGKLTHQDMQKDTAYNTYLHRGLPPTPIAMVGKEAIQAAAHPAQSDYLYFVAKGDGSHEFSRTYSEQKKAIFRYIKEK